MGISTFLQGRVPTRLRGAQFFAMIETGFVQVRTVASDAGGGGTSSWVTRVTTPCAVESFTGRGGGGGGGLTAGAIDETSTHMITVPIGVNVRLAERVIIDGRGTFEVTGIRDGTGMVVQTFMVIQV